MELVNEVSSHFSSFPLPFASPTLTNKTCKYYALDFSFTKLYDRTLNKSCPVAKESKILLTIPGDSIAAFEILPVEGMIIRKEDDREVAVWDSTIGE